MKGYRFGFWRLTKQGNKKDKHPLPWPKRQKIRESLRDRLLKGFVRAERRASMRGFRGRSQCRICKKRNGSREYKLHWKNVRFCWPEGASHYVRSHGVVPGRYFRALLLKFGSRK